MTCITDRDTYQLQQTLPLVLNVWLISPLKDHKLNEVVTLKTTKDTVPWKCVLGAYANYTGPERTAQPHKLIYFHAFYSTVNPRYNDSNCSQSCCHY